MSVRPWGLALALLSCSSPQAARYPSWEPTSVVVPAVEGRDVARRHLDESRRIWNAFGWERYTYVRARQLSEDEVRFTVLVVEGRSVVERSVFTMDPGPSGLGDFLYGHEGAPPKAHWTERGQEVGTHREAEPPVTVDALYDFCRDEVLSKRPDLVPRLYFHHNGVLQHCGFLTDDCPDCPAASIQVVSDVGPRPWQQLKDYLCADRYGVFLPLMAPLKTHRCQKCMCGPRNTSDPRAHMRAPASEETLTNICDIDPAACPKVDHGRAAWECMWLLSATCGTGGGIVRALEPMCVGRRNPAVLDAEWLRRCR